MLASILSFLTFGFFSALILWAIGFKVRMFLLAMDSSSMD